MEEIILTMCSFIAHSEKWRERERERDYRSSLQHQTYTSLQEGFSYLTAEVEQLEARNPE
jgi:hypothetical protein